MIFRGPIILSPYTVGIIKHTHTHTNLVILNNTADLQLLDAISQRN